MMSVRRFGHGPGAESIGKPTLHPAAVDLKGKAYEYVISFLSLLLPPISIPMGHLLQLQGIWH